MYPFCPHCKKEIPKVNTRNMRAIFPERNGDPIACVAYICPECNAVISIESDPNSRATEIRLLRSEFSALNKRLDDDFDKLQKRFFAVGSALQAKSSEQESLVSKIQRANTQN